MLKVWYTKFSEKVFYFKFYYCYELKFKKHNFILVSYNFNVYFKIVL